MNVRHLALVVAVVLAGCTGRDDPTVTPAPSASAAVTPGATASPSASVGVSPTPPDGSTTRPVKIFLVLVGDRVPPGAPTFGCGDAVQAVDRDVAAAGPALEAAVRALLAERTGSDPTAGPYSVFNASALTLESATVAGGTATIRLRGELRLGGVCDSPRVEESARTVWRTSSASKAP